MRLSRPSTAEAALLLLFPVSISAWTYRCDDIVVDKLKFDLSPLGGPHSVMISEEQLPSIRNTTYTLDVCKPLERPKSVKNGDDFCHGGTRVCAIERTIRHNPDADFVSKVVSIAGDLSDWKGGPLDSTISRLKTSPSHADAEKDGLRMELNGGIFENRKQRAIIEFLCDPDRTGNEGTVVTAESLKYRRDDEASAVNETSLKFIKYGPDPANENVDLLRLEWKTKYACEDAEEVPASAGWGFFTWFILIAFMVTAAYLIFGSWLNYNRYGARGWDLLPHGDTIRDVPYLFKDWIRRVLNTVQGGSRGGYSAV